VRLLLLVAGRQPISFWFGDFELDQERRQLLRSSEPVPLQPKAYELLSLLLQRRPRVLSRAQIRDVIWPGTFVSESTLAVVVTGLRQALGDDARQPRFIRTVHRFGYAFCGEARESKNGGPEPREALVAGGLDDLESVPAEAKPLDGTGIGRTAATLIGRWRWAIAAAGVIVLVSAAWLATRRPRLPDEPQEVVPLTSLPGTEAHPALSPDGSRVAFIWHGPDQENFDVYVKEIASGDMVRVTKDPAPDFHPVWSPDGRTLAFLRLQTTGAAVFLVPAGGGQEQRLAEVAEPLNALTHQDIWSYWLDWSPDGRFLAAADRVADGSGWGIVLVSVETGEKRTLTANTDATTADLFPTFSPDGRRLAFLRGRPKEFSRSDLMIQPLSTDTRPQARGSAVVVKELIPGWVAWLPSGDELVVGGQRVSLNGSPPRPFRLHGQKLSELPWGGPAVSIRGAKLAFDTGELRGQLVRVPLAGATASFVPFFPSTRGESEPAVAPDGKRVAFTSWRSGKGRIWIGDADGSSCHELAPPQGSTYPGSPSWSPDGRRLAFDDQVGGVFHVYIATPEGGTLRRLTSGQAFEVRPGWSRDGRFIYFASTHSGDWQLWKTPADAEDTDPAAVQVTRSGGMEAEESPDGRYVYYAKRNAAGIFRLSLEAQGTPDEEKVLDFGGEGRWRLTPRGIFALDVPTGHSPRIRFYDLATRATSVVLELPMVRAWALGETGGAFTVSPDERWALLTAFQVVESDIMLVEGFR
jgi:Tol biopolymer transport system component/DNA-binding winged helix-turn-helix (wHTH) protein